MENRKSLLNFIEKEGRELTSVNELKFVNNVNKLSQNLSDEEYETVANLMAKSNNRGLKYGLLAGLLLAGSFAIGISLANSSKKREDEDFDKLMKKFDEEE